MRWIGDDEAPDCANCSRSFVFLFRHRHHCRSCGRVFCDRCSQSRMILTDNMSSDDPVVQALESDTIRTALRICDECASSLLSSEHSEFVHLVEKTVVDDFDLWKLFGSANDDSNQPNSVYSKEHVVLAVSSTVSDRHGKMVSFRFLTNPSSQVLLETCPVCQLDLNLWSSRRSQDHVHKCMSLADSGERMIRGDRFSIVILKSEDMVNSLPEECPICYEDFEAGQELAILNCLCKFHQRCISDWFLKVPSCPLHP